MTALALTAIWMWMFLFRYRFGISRVAVPAIALRGAVWLDEGLGVRKPACGLGSVAPGTDVCGKPVMGYAGCGRGCVYPQTAAASG